MYTVAPVRKHAACNLHGVTAATITVTRRSELQRLRLAAAFDAHVSAHVRQTRTRPRCRSPATVETYDAVAQSNTSKTAAIVCTLQSSTPGYSTAAAAAKDSSGK
eukprot:1340-Heterococcus_DN1.PRE.5